MNVVPVLVWELLLEAEQIVIVSALASPRVWMARREPVCQPLAVVQRSWPLVAAASQVVWRYSLAKWVWWNGQWQLVRWQCLAQLIRRQSLPSLIESSIALDNKCTPQVGLLSERVRSCWSLGWAKVWSVCLRANRVGAVEPAHLNNTLKVDIHRVGELEGLEVGVGDNSSRRPKVFNLVKFGHDFGANDASHLVDKLDGCSFAIMCDAVAHHHVKLGIFIFDTQDHGHGLANFDYATDFT